VTKVYLQSRQRVTHDDDRDPPGGYTDGARGICIGIVIGVGLWAFAYMVVRGLGLVS
jgi:hypothetical protein